MTECSVALIDIDAIHFALWALGLHIVYVKKL